MELRIVDAIESPLKSTPTLPLWLNPLHHPESLANGCAFLLRACWYDSNIKNAAPSPTTRPFLFSSNGLQLLDASLLSANKPADFITFIMESFITDSTPPTTATSQAPEWIILAPVAIAAAPDEHVDDNVKDGPEAFKY